MKKNGQAKVCHKKFSENLINQIYILTEEYNNYQIINYSEVMNKMKNLNLIIIFNIQMKRLLIKILMNN